MNIQQRIDNLLKTIDTVNPKLFLQPEEAELYTELLNGAVFAGTVEAFFDKVLVQCDNVSLRLNRIALLRKLQQFYSNSEKLYVDIW